MSTHPRPAGPADALSTRLRSETAEVHRAAEQRPFMLAFFNGELDRAAYVDWLRRQRHVYGVLEQALTALPEGDPASRVVPAVLHRAARIEADLDDLTGCDWRADDHATPATAAYVERIEQAADAPPRLLAHAWLRYLGNVGGRDVLRRLTAEAIGVDPTTAGDTGLRVTDYSALGDEVGPFFREFHAALDALPLTAAEQDDVVTEARIGFSHNIALTDELAADHGLL